MFFCNKRHNLAQLSKTSIPQSPPFVTNNLFPCPTKKTQRKNAVSFKKWLCPAFLLVLSKKQIVPKAKEKAYQKSNHSILLYCLVSTNSPRSLCAMPAHCKIAAKTNTGSKTESPYVLPRSSATAPTTVVLSQLLSPSL